MENVLTKIITVRGQLGACMPDAIHPKILQDETGNTKIGVLEYPMDCTISYILAVPQKYMK